MRPTTKPRPKTWSHQQELERLIGRAIYLRFSDGGPPSKGRLLGADQFSLNVMFDGETAASVIFKAVLAGFRAA